MSLRDDDGGGDFEEQDIDTWLSLLIHDTSYHPVVRIKLINFGKVTDSHVGALANFFTNPPVSADPSGLELKS